jgi:hypothetical protein
VEPEEESSLSTQADVLDLVMRGDLSMDECAALAIEASPDESEASVQGSEDTFHSLSEPDMSEVMVDDCGEEPAAATPCGDELTTLEMAPVPPQCRVEKPRVDTPVKVETKVPSNTKRNRRKAKQASKSAGRRMAYAERFATKHADLPGNLQPPGSDEHAVHPMVVGSELMVPKEVAPPVVVKWIGVHAAAKECRAVPHDLPPNVEREVRTGAPITMDYMFRRIAEETPIEPEVAEELREEMELNNIT